MANPFIGNVWRPEEMPEALWKPTESIDAIRILRLREALALPKFIKEAERLFAVRRRKWRNGVHLNDTLLLSHWTRIGSGYYGEAWKHDLYPELVLKISGREGWGFDNWRKDKNKGRHKSCTDVKDAWAAFAMLCTTDKYKCIQELPKVFHFVQASEGLAWAVMRRYERRSHDYEEHQRYVSQVVNLGWFSQLQMDVEAATGIQVNSDIHGDNVMHCPVLNHLVITDPFSTTSNRSYKHASRQKQQRV